MYMYIYALLHCKKLVKEYGQSDDKDKITIIQHDTNKVIYGLINFNFEVL